MEYVIFIIISAVLKESLPLNPEILKYDQYMKDFETTGRRIKQEEKDKIDGLVMKRESRIGNSDEITTMENFTPFHWNNSSEEESKKRFTTPIVPVITNVNHTEAMGKLRDLWVTQQKHFENAKKAIRELCDKTDQDVTPIGYLFEQIDPLLERQVRVLTQLPWKNSDEMYEVVDDWLIDQQRRSWEALGRCMTDQYDFLSEDDKKEEGDVRKLFDTAKRDLLNRRKEVINSERSAQKLDGNTIEYEPVPIPTEKAPRG